MKDIDLIYYKYIKTLYNIKDVDTDIDKNILRLFNEYISSNKDFKYNKSYLDDSVEDFMNCVNTFKKKQKFVEEAKEKLSKKYNWYEIQCVRNCEIRTIEDIHEEIFAEIEKI